MLLLSLLACEPLPLELSLDTPEVGECEVVCVTLRGEPEAAFTLEGGPGEAPVDSVLDSEGERELCWEPPLRPGIYALVARSGHGLPVSARLEVHPFGWTWGLERTGEALEEVSWTPLIRDLDQPPVLEPTEGAWDGLSVMAATTLWHQGRRLLYYAGTDEEEFALGLATRPHDQAPFAKYSGSPILQDPDVAWKRYAQSNPEAEAVGDEVWLWYTGRSGDEGGLSIGLATSTDGLYFEDHPDNPVLTGTMEAEDFDKRGVAHPSVVQRDGVFELWYASGTLEIGYALSIDGVEWTRSCSNPVLSPPADTWYEGGVKAPEVHFDGERYWMAFSGGGHGNYQVGWAESLDGTRWVVADVPVIPRQPGGWASEATQEASIEVDRDGWWFWFTGNDGTSQRIGRGWASAP